VSGFEAEQIGFDRQRISVGHPCKRCVGHGGIKILSIASDAAMNRFQELCVRPGADSGVPVRRDVGRIDRAERRDERETSCKRRAARSRVAGLAVGGTRQIFAAPHKARGAKRGRNASRITAAIIVQCHRAPFCKVERAGPQRDPKESRQENSRDRNDTDNCVAPQEAKIEEPVHDAFLPARTSRSNGSRRRGMPVAA